MPAPAKPKTPVAAPAKSATQKQRSLAPVGSADPRLEKSLRRSIDEGMLNASSGSIFATFLAPLALELKATNFQIGLLETAQQVAATLGMLPGARLTEFYSRKAIWLLCQLMGRVVIWIPLILLPFLNLADPVTVLIIIAACAAFFTALRVPAWTSLMGDLVTIERRGRYFGRRNMITGFAGIVVTIISGLILAGVGFPVIFAIGLILSLLSIPLFWQMHEPSTPKVFHYRHSFSINPREWATSLRVHSRLVLFTIFMASFNFAVAIAGPFYTVFMIRDLGISYELFALATIVGAAVRIIAFPYWGKLNDRFGSRRILVITALFGCVTPFLWLFVSSFWHIILVKLFDGFIWAGLEQVAFTYLLDITPARKRPQFVANYSFFSGWGIILGALAGGFLAEAVQSSVFLGLAGLQIVFFASFLLRIVAMVLLPRLKEADIRQTEVMPVTHVMWRTMAVEPAHGLRNMVHFTFRYPFDREAEYVRSIRRRRIQQKMQDDIIAGSHAALGNKKVGSDTKDEQKKRNPR